jgi:GH25 family lysozyme M1 (1,4-beta-N-acetylmuramidase)
MATLLSIDVSNHQGNVDFAAVRAAGDALVFIKATEGVGYVDPQFLPYRRQARAAGLTRGFYHFARAGDPIAEADAFCAAVSPLDAGDLVALDWETAAPNPPAWCRTWLQRVAHQLGVVPGVYLNQSTRDAYDWSALVADNDWLWVADYDNSPTVLAGPGKWPVVAIKQWTSTGSVPGINGPVDQDTFEGDATALAAYGYQGDNVNQQDIQAIAQAVWMQDIGGVHARDRLQGVDSIQLPALSRAVAAIQPAKVDVAALAAQIVAALPAAEAQQVADLVIAGIGQRIVTAKP